MLFGCQKSREIKNPLRLHVNVMDPLRLHVNIMDYYKLYFHNCTFTISSCGNTISNFQIVLPKLYFHYIFMLKYNFQILLPQLYFHNCTFIVKRNGFLYYFFQNCNDITMVNEKTHPILLVLALVSNILHTRAFGTRIQLHYLLEQGHVILDSFFHPP